MKLFSYIPYFFYLGFNWNWRIACYILSQEIKGEKKYHIVTTGVDNLKKLQKKGMDTSHATIYMPVSYSLLETVLKEVPALYKNHFLDIGCGKGRAMCVAAHFGFMRLTGVDFSKELCIAAENNLIHTRENIPALDFSVINEDAARYDIPPDVDCIFLFNPFDVVIMGAVVSNIMESLEAQPRNLMVVYINPLYKELFLDEGFTEVYYFKQMKYLEGIILSKYVVFSI